MMLVSRRLPHFTFLSLRREILEAVPTKFRRVEGIVHAGVYSFVIFPRGADGVDNRGFGVGVAIPVQFSVLADFDLESKTPFTRACDAKQDAQETPKEESRYLMRSRRQC